MRTHYRVLHGWKYRLEDDYVVLVPISGVSVSTEYIALTENGTLVIGKGYTWDGPSGPTIDTPCFMRGALVHDVWYQLIRMELLPYSTRKAADKLLYQICRADGMHWFRAAYVYLAVRWFGASAAKPGTQDSPDIRVFVEG